MARRALVTGASSGIGAATVRALIGEGFDVLATARREDRLRALSEQTGCAFVAADLTNDDGVDAVARAVDAVGGVDVLVNDAGGALGTDSVAEGKLNEWRRMYEINVISTLALTQKLLPFMRENGGDVVFVLSTASLGTYPGGAGYVAAKHAERQIADTLRLELMGEPVRIISINPGMVKTDEFSLVRFHGDAEKAAAVYAGVEAPLLAEDIAECVRWAVTLPAHVNIDSLTVRPVAQASNTLVARR
ncbi:MAG: SDR family NAD(P)-dependent oxidoreductase [Actinomycetaceae bacterium]|nr:SDR family NAD(P)-dependent oxidoreductase [Arcanobacterium sp.]MDD7505799.1 SDR family NAD(P)-dependent oxidoreductase [Actinomycetaceae bacterium]MDY6142890.1 SDR family NAD(P)-dependent oxidoreductase [Arcanobacterium sp.]